jgi:hypothetical protein
MELYQREQRWLTAVGSLLSEINYQFNQKENGYEKKLFIEFTYDDGNAFYVMHQCEQTI